jgi:diguanylate cyclase (GGDEF)-like protein
MPDVTLQMIPMPALLIDGAGSHVLDANSLACDILRSSREDLSGTPVDEIILDWAVHMQRKSSRPGRRPRQFASRSHRRDGRGFQGTWRIGPADAAGRVIATLLHHPPVVRKVRRTAVGAGARPFRPARSPSTRVEGVDYLTGLSDRWVLESLVEVALNHRNDSDGPSFGLLLVDLDGFKEVNDRLGHLEGDRVLAVVAERLVANVRPTDLVTRYGGDEFIIYADPVNSRGDMHHIAERIIAAVRDPIPGNHGDIHISASVGIAFGSEAFSLPGLIEVADRVMYAAKSRGGDGFRDSTSLPSSC